ncbi:MAG: T9SS type A sorting domain-containing protein [Lewinellaceae bacterium]|nr:T9SS type A sorting domain-containing protein [Lewinellaceae bacterium]
MNSLDTRFSPFFIKLIMAVLICVGIADSTRAQSHTFATFSPGTVTSNTAGVSTALSTAGVTGDYLYFEITADFVGTGNVAWSNSMNVEISNGASVIYKDVSHATSGAMPNPNATTLYWTGVLQREYVGGGNLTVRFWDDYHDASGPYTSSVTNVVVTIHQPSMPHAFAAFSPGTVTSNTPGVSTALNTSGISGDYLFFEITANFVGTGNVAWSNTMNVEISDGASVIYKDVSRATSGAMLNPNATTLHWTGVLNKKYTGGNLTVRFWDDYHDASGPYTSSITNVNVTIYKIAQPHVFATFSPGTVTSNTPGVSTALSTAGVTGDYLFFEVTANFVGTGNVAWSNTMNVEISNGASVIYKDVSRATSGAMPNPNATTLYWTGVLNREYVGGGNLTVRFWDDYHDASGPYTSSITNVIVRISEATATPVCPTITFTSTSTDACTGSNNGEIAITGVTGGTAPYMYSKNGGSVYQSGATFTGLAAAPYMMVVKDADGCLSGAISDTVHTLPLPSCSISGADYVCDNSPGNIYTAPDNMSAYAWSIGGDGSIPGLTNEQSVSVNAGNLAGNFTLYLTVTGANGCTSTCNKLSDILLATPPADITVSSNPVCFGVTIDLSIAAAATSTVSWSGSGIGNPSGNPSTTALPAATGPQGYSVTVTAGNGCSNTDAVEVSVITCNIDFSGKITWERDDVSGVKDATVNLTGSAAGSEATDLFGEYSISTMVSSGSFTLKPVKNINKFNGVTAGDVTAIQQHVANITPITDPYILVCADVNKSNSVSGLDATLLNQALLGNPVANNLFNTSWRFVPLSWVLSNPPWGFPEQIVFTSITESQTDQDFVGMKIGDVTGDANPANLAPEQPLVLRLDDRSPEAGEIMEVQISAGQKDNLAAFQCALRFDPALLELIDIQPGNTLPLQADNFGIFKVAEGEIRVVWSQPAGIPIAEDAPLFLLRFKSLGAGFKLGEALLLDETELPALAYTDALEESEVEWVYLESTSAGQPANNTGMQLFQNRPNPFSGSTVIGFALPEACEAQLRVYDLSGRLLQEYAGWYPAGRNEVEVDMQGAVPQGVLFYELTSPYGVLTKKMVLTGQ